MLDDFFRKRTELDSLPLEKKYEIMAAVRRQTRKRTWAIRWSSGTSFFWLLFVILIWGSELKPWMIAAGFGFIAIVGAWGFVVDMIGTRQLGALMEKVYDEEFADELRRRGLAKGPGGTPSDARS